MVNLGAIIEARMGSSRLPGKVILEANNKPLIIHLVNRLKQSKLLKTIVVATTLNKKDDILCKILKKNKIFFFRGSENDVLGRIYLAAKKFKLKNILQVTGDCPLVDPFIVSQVIKTYQNNNFDFVSNANLRTYPIGMDLCVFSFKNLQKSSYLAKQKYYREHSTLFIRKKKNLFSHCNIMAPSNLHYPNLGLTLDENSDYLLIKNIFKRFKNKENTFSCLEIIDYLKKNKKLLNINKKVQRKKLPIIIK